MLSFLFSHTLLHIFYLFPFSFPFSSILPPPISTMSAWKISAGSSQPFGVWTPADIPIHPKILSVDAVDSVFLSVFFLLGGGGVGCRRQKVNYPHKNSVSKMNHVHTTRPLLWCITHRPNLSLTCSFADPFNPISSPIHSFKSVGLPSFCLEVWTWRSVHLCAAVSHSREGLHEHGELQESFCPHRVLSILWKITSWDLSLTPKLTGTHTGAYRNIYLLNVQNAWREITVPAVKDL